ncbi:hypothetical protein ACRASX_06440 [Flavobacterium sp. TMP13]
MRYFLPILSLTQPNSTKKGVPSNNAIPSNSPNGRTTNPAAKVVKVDKKQ